MKITGEISVLCFHLPLLHIPTLLRSTWKLFPWRFDLYEVSFVVSHETALDNSFNIKEKNTFIDIWRWTKIDWEYKFTLPVFM